MIPKFLYRALRKIEIDNGFVLIPKSTDQFRQEATFGMDMVFPISFNSAENAARHHNWEQNGSPTRGISTTPFYERALFYAKRNNSPIAKIDTTNFEKLGININFVRDIKHGIAVPEDDEHILIYEKDGPFPNEIIVEVLKDHIPTG
jgi:hypothetical protein